MRRMIQVLILALFAIAILVSVPKKVATNQETEVLAAIEQAKSNPRMVTPFDEEEGPTEMPSIETLSCVKPAFKTLNIPLEDEYQRFVFDCSDAYNVNPFLILALMESESSFEVDAKGDWDEDGYGNRYYKSYGLMQINKVNWDRMERDYSLDVFEPFDNIEAGIIIFKEGLTDSLTESIMNYKCGKRRAAELIEQGIILSSCEEIANKALEWENCYDR